MESELAVKRLSALAQSGRLDVFRLLVRSGHEGLAAGDIARATQVPANTLSAQMTVLANAGLVKSRRDGRSIIYTADYDGMGDLLVYLMEDCCQGRPEICASITQSAIACCTPAQGALS